MRRTSRGFSLIEVLIALLIVSFGMIGVGTALLVVHRSTGSSYLQQESVQLAANIIDRMRQNSAAAQSGAYDITYVGGALAAPAQMCDPSGAACTGPQQASYDVWQWVDGLKRLLPGANATVAVAVGAAGEYEATVVVSYDDTPAGSTLKSGATRRAIQLETAL